MAQLGFWYGELPPRYLLRTEYRYNNPRSTGYSDLNECFDLMLLRDIYGLWRDDTWYIEHHSFYVVSSIYYYGDIRGGGEDDA